MESNDRVTVYAVHSIIVVAAREGDGIIRAKTDDVFSIKVVGGRLDIGILNRIDTTRCEQHNDTATCDSIVDESLCNIDLYAKTVRSGKSIVIDIILSENISNTHI